MIKKETEFKKCCAEEIQQIWNEYGGSMNIVRYEGKCSNCNHYIGLTQTSKEEANNFLIKYNLI